MEGRDQVQVLAGTKLFTYKKKMSSKGRQISGHTNSEDIDYERTFKM